LASFGLDTYYRIFIKLHCNGNCDFIILGNLQAMPRELANLANTNFAARQEQNKQNKSTAENQQM
jgi:hypothetical protein